MSQEPGSWLALTLGWLDMKNPRGFGYACELAVGEVASDLEWATWRDAVGIEKLDIGVLYQPVASDDMTLQRRQRTVTVDLTRSGARLSEGTEERLLGLARRELQMLMDQVRDRIQPIDG